MQKKLLYFGKSFSLIGWVMERLRALIGANENVDDVKDYLIELYREYNAPLPKELVERVTEKIIDEL